MSLPSYTQKLELLYELLRLSASGTLQWQCEELDTLYSAHLGELQFSIEFIRFLRVDEVGSDKVVAQLYANQKAYDFCIGTEGFDILIACITYSFPSWRSSWETGVEKLKDTLTVLRKKA